MDPELTSLRESLLARRPVGLTAEDGDEAFDRHILLAARVHRATRLAQSVSDNESGAWVRFFEAYFPEGRNDRIVALTLFQDWRCSLVKDEYPSGRVGVTHGQPGAHWRKDMRGALCIDLESMWDDFASAVDALLAAMETDKTLRVKVLDRWGKRSWTVQPFQQVQQQPLGSSGGSGFTGWIPVGSVSATSGTAPWSAAPLPANRKAPKEA